MERDDTQPGSNYPYAHPAALSSQDSPVSTHSSAFSPETNTFSSHSAYLPEPTLSNFHTPQNEYTWPCPQLTTPSSTTPCTSQEGQMAQQHRQALPKSFRLDARRPDEYEQKQFAENVQAGSMSKGSKNQDGLHMKSSDTSKFPSLMDPKGFALGITERQITAVMASDRRGTTLESQRHPALCTVNEEMQGRWGCNKSCVCCFTIKDTIYGANEAVGDKDVGAKDDEIARLKQEVQSFAIEMSRLGDELTRMYSRYGFQD